MRKYRVIAALLFVMVVLPAAIALAAATGGIKLDVLGDMGKGVKDHADVFDAAGAKVGEVQPGQTVQLPAGKYKLVLPFVGGKITKDNLVVESGRTHTVLITDVAVLSVSVKDTNGKDPGFGVTVTGTNPPHDKVAEFVSGDAILIAPSQVDVKVDAPPQGYYWHGVELPPGRRANLVLGESKPAELVVQPIWSNLALDKETRVVVYKAGTQSQVTESGPGPEHRMKVEPGDYDVYVENHSGKGQPYATDNGIHVNSGETVERKVSLGGEVKSDGK